MCPVPRAELKNAKGRIICSLSLGEGDTGALLIHGYLATPEEMRGLAEHLANDGLMVHAPLVAGHGTSLADLLQTTWQDWYASVEAALAGLQEQ